MLYTMVCKQNLVCSFVSNWFMACLFWNCGTTPEVWWWKLLPVERLSMETKFHQTRWFKEPQKVSSETSRIWFTFALSKAKQGFRKSPACIAGIPGSSRQCDPEVGILCLVPQQGNSRSSLQLHGALGSAASSHHPAHSTATQIPAATPAKDHQVAVQAWSKEPKGSRGDQEYINFSLRSRKVSKYSLSRIATEGKLSSCQIQELLLYLKLKRKIKCSFFWFLENQKPWITASLKRTLYVYPYVQTMYLYGYLISENSPAEKLKLSSAWLKGAISILILVPEVSQTEISLFLP